MFKKLLLSLVVLIGLVLIVAYFLPRDFRLSKSVVINAPRETVYDYVRFLKNQEKYSVWVMADPNVKMTYTGTDGTVGAISAWVSDDKNVGVGEQEIKALVPNEKMTVEIRFQKPMEGTNYSDTVVEAIDATHTKVTNSFYGSNPYPFNIMCQFMDMLVGGDMEKNMENLKKNLETQEPKYFSEDAVIGTWQDNENPLRKITFDYDMRYEEIVDSKKISGLWKIFTKVNPPSDFSTLLQNLEDNKTYIIMVANPEYNIATEGYMSIKNMSDSSLELLIEPSNERGGIIKFTKIK